jgi:hypothetical protein
MMIIKVGNFSKNEKKIMAKTYHAPLYVRLANVMMKTLLRAGIKVVGFKNYEIYLLTVRGRKSGQPRSVPLALLGRNEKRYVACAGQAIGYSICGRRERLCWHVSAFLKR